MADTQDVRNEIVYCPKCGEIADRYPNQNVYQCRMCEWEGSPVVLSPCPFCGSKARLSLTEGADWVIQCGGKDCTAVMFDSCKLTEDYDGIMDVVNKWNKRTA